MAVDTARSVAPRQTHGRRLRWHVWHQSRQVELMPVDDHKRLWAGQAVLDAADSPSWTIAREQLQTAINREETK